MTTSFTLATFNLFNYAEPPNAYYTFSNIYSDAEWQAKQDWITRMLHNSQADIIGFQEVFSPAALESLVSAAGYPYFSVIDQPTVNEGYLCSAPVLAIASRFPIEQVVAVMPKPPFSNPGTGGEDTAFSRTPLHAVINIEDIGPVHVLVVHLKSQRPTLPDTDTENSTEQPSPSTDINNFKSTLWGEWLSQIQRGTEANLLYSYLADLQLQADYPVIVMGDFNQSLQSAELSVLTRQHILCNARGEARNLQLFDSWALYCHQQGGENLSWSRHATHYHGAVGHTLDYILLSDHCDQNNSHSRLRVSDYLTLDQHLTNPRFEYDQQASDHALVCVTLSRVLPDN